MVRGFFDSECLGPNYIESMALVVLKIRLNFAQFFFALLNSSSVTLVAVQGFNVSDVVSKIRNFRRMLVTKPNDIYSNFKLFFWALPSPLTITLFIRHIRSSINFDLTEILFWVKMILPIFMILMQIAENLKEWKKRPTNGLIWIPQNPGSHYKNTLSRATSIQSLRSIFFTTKTISRSVVCVNHLLVHFYIFLISQINKLRKIDWLIDSPYKNFVLTIPFSLVPNRNGITEPCPCFGAKNQKHLNSEGSTRGSNIVFMWSN